MPINYQFARADGAPDWTVGQEDFAAVFDGASDWLRFHKGGGFVIIADGKEGPKRRLWELEPFLKTQLDSAKTDTPIRVKALRDRYMMAFRRHQVESSKAVQLIAAMERRRGLPYVFGGMDCSGLVMTCVQAVTGILLPHMASAMRDDPRMKSISRENAKMGDFLFIDRDGYGKEHHIATLWDTNSERYPGGWVVWDTQPHSTSSPSGWPSPYLGTGVQIRPAFRPWYDGDISSYGRLAAING
jgi:hypothetical protein